MTSAELGSERRKELRERVLLEGDLFKNLSLDIAQLSAKTIDEETLAETMSEASSIDERGHPLCPFKGRSIRELPECIERRILDCATSGVVALKTDPDHIEALVALGADRICAMCLELIPDAHPLLELAELTDLKSRRGRRDRLTEDILGEPGTSTNR